MTSDPHEEATPPTSGEGDAAQTPPVADPEPPPGPDQPPDPEAATDLPDDVEEFTPEQIDAIVAERDEFLDAYRRTAADFDNFRKLSQKRQAEEVARSQGSFVERLLPVLDAIDAARTQGSDHVEAVASALFTFLEKEGLERVHPVDETFDPNVAEAVVHEPADTDEPDAPPVVSEVLRTGYLWRGRVIRPAMVKVSG